MRPLWLLLGLLLLAPSAHGEEVARVVLPNGMRVLAKPDPGTDVVAIELLLDITSADEPAGKAGIRYLVQRLLLRGTTTEAGDSMGRRLSAVGGTADVSVGLDYVELYALVPAEGFKLALDMLADMVRHPAFLADEVAGQRRAALDMVRAGEEDAFQQAYLALREAFYEGHSYARSVFGEIGSLASLTRDDLVWFHRAHYQPRRAVLAICGGVTSARALRAAERAFADWADGAGAPRPAETVRPLSAPRVIAREVPGQRAHLMIGFPAPAAAAPGYYELQLIDSLLSGRAGARLPKKLREELGLVYDVSSFYPTLAGPSHIAVYVITEPDGVEEVKTRVLAALQALAEEPVSEAELSRAKRYLLGSYALARQRQKDQAYSLAWYEVLGPGTDFGLRYVEGTQAVTPGRLQQTARAVFRHFAVAAAMPTG